MRCLFVLDRNMGCGGSRPPTVLVFERTLNLMFPESWEGLSDEEVFDYIFVNTRTPKMEMQFCDITHVCNAFNVKGGMITHIADVNKTSHFITKQRLGVDRMTETTFVAKGTHGNPHVIKAKSIVIVNTDYQLARTGGNVHFTCTVKRSDGSSLTWE